MYTNGQSFEPGRVHYCDSVHLLFERVMYTCLYVSFDSENIENVFNVWSPRPENFAFTSSFLTVPNEASASGLARF